MIKKLLSRIDMFGVIPQFSVNSEETFKSYIGGIFTINCGIFLVIFIVFFGDDFYNKKNPKVIESKIFYEISYNRNLTTNQGIIAWRIDDHYAKVPNFTGILYPKVIYSSFVLNQTTNNLDLVSEKVLPNKNCSEVKDLDNLFKTTYDPSSWFCLDFSGIDFELGGYWGEKYVNMIYLVIDSCNEDKTKCSNDDEIMSLFPGSNNNLFFSMIYPTHYFSPLNISSPLNYEYYYYFETIDLNIIKKNLFFFREVMCDDDMGWIFQDIKQHKIFSFEYSTKDYFYRSHYNFEVINKDINTFIYMNSLYFSKNNYLYKRSFMKIQELAAVVGGILKSVVLGFSLFATFFNNITMKAYLINKFFLRTVETKKADYILQNISYDNIKKLKNPITDLNKNSDISLRKIKEKKINQNKNINITKFHVKKDFRLNQNSSDLIFTKKNNFFDKKKDENNLSVDINKIKLNSEDEIIRRKIEYLNKSKSFGIKNIFLNLLCDRSNYQYKKFNLADKFLTKNMSYEMFTKKTILFNKLTDILLDNRQKLLFNLIEPYNLDDQNDYERITDFVNNEIGFDMSYFKKVLEVYNGFNFDKGNLNENDCKLINNCNLDKYLS